MASAAAHLCSSFIPNHKSGNCWTRDVHTGKLHRRDKSTTPAKFHLLKAKAAKEDRDRKPKSVICTDCDGNGAVLCSQCKGSGVNSEDLFNGEFKAGDDCWLCGGRKEMLCGNCNGAGFLGGFMSTFDQ